MIRTAVIVNGVVKGIEAADPRITAFKGIPYAAPPVGENRWRAPQPCKDWKGTLHAYRFAPISIQDTPALVTIFIAENGMWIRTLKSKIFLLRRNARL